MLSYSFVYTRSTNSITLHFIDFNGDRKTVEAAVGDSIYQAVVDNQIVPEGMCVVYD